MHDNDNYAYMTLKFLFIQQGNDNMVSCRG